MKVGARQGSGLPGVSLRTDVDSEPGGSVDLSQVGDALRIRAKS